MATECQIVIPKKDGRPSPYQDVYCDLTPFLNWCEVNGMLPATCTYAVWLGVCEKTVYNWKDEHPEFKDALERLKTLQLALLIRGGLNKIYDPQITKLLLSHAHGIRESTNWNFGGQPDNPIVNLNSSEEAKKYYLERLNLINEAEKAGTALVGGDE